MLQHMGRRGDERRGEAERRGRQFSRRERMRSWYGRVWGKHQTWGL